ncbi:sucrose phosphorylase [Pseudoalteromonas sp. YIC-656]|uniref:sucrose phosphorylase n=1 Tax=Pseudoalteromonas pernae TaxID=3118054 RepID=UPI003242001E
MKNNVQLITYVDRLTGAGVPELAATLEGPLSQLFSGVHLLPFYYPIDGSDAGFDPIDHTLVDERLGTWHDVKQLGANTELMADLIVNHMSAQSPEFKDVLAKGRESAYWDLFLTKDKVFPNGLTPELQSKIYRPRPGSCFTAFTLPNGEVAEFWTTFTDNQIDIDVHSQAGKAYLHRILNTFANNNIKMIRLDAAGYAIKKAGTSCFMLDETFDFIGALSEYAQSLGIETLVEIHSYYKTQIDIAERVGMVYDFALPPLVLHSIFNQDVTALVNWLTISPRNCITVLDTHDGIGIIDVGPMEGQPGLLSDNEIDTLVETIHRKSHGESKKATGAAASNVDLYQVNCTYYDALGKDDYDYLVARAIQFFSPGTPQVYYGGLLAQHNDMQLLAASNVGRDINRPYLDSEKLTLQMQRPVVQALMKLIALRNDSAAFDGQFDVQGQGSRLTLRWQNEAQVATLNLDLAKRSGVIELESDGHSRIVNLSDLISL